MLVNRVAKFTTRFNIAQNWGQRYFYGVKSKKVEVMTFHSLKSWSFLTCASLFSGGIERRALMSFFLSMCEKISAAPEPERAGISKTAPALSKDQLPALTVAAVISVWDHLPERLFKMLMSSLVPERTGCAHVQQLRIVNNIQKRTQAKFALGDVCAHHLAGWSSSSFLNFRPFVCVKVPKAKRMLDGKCEACKVLGATPTPQEALEVRESAPQTQPSPVALAPSTKVKHF